MCNISERLLEERKRLGVNQDKMAKAGGVAKRTYCNYEAGEREPTGSFFAGISALGADVQYILTGTRASAQPDAGGLSVDEQVLLEGYRALDARGKRDFLAVSAGLGQASGGKVVQNVSGSPKFVAGGNIGTAIEGGIKNGTVTVTMHDKKPGDE